MARDETENGTGGAETSGGWRATKGENGTGGAETSGGWRATKRENGTGGAKTSGGWRETKTGKRHGRGGSHKQGGGKIDASRPQQQTQPNKLAVTPE